MKLLVIVALLGLINTAAEAKQHRSQKVLREFQLEHPCPSLEARNDPRTHNGTRGACFGYVKDHVHALACGGRDAVENLQWQTVWEAQLKDRWELRECHK